MSIDLVRCWYGRCVWLYLLAPVSLLFGLVVWLRRMGYRLGLLKSHTMPVPVIVVGNISVGGTGKTPLILWLAHRLREAGLRPGIISRGYGGAGGDIRPVQADTAPVVGGDEPVLLARRSGCPVWTGKDRVATARALLDHCPEVDVVLSDDGLQHYALARDMEIVLVDGARGHGNGWLMPVGPLREPVSRLKRAQVLVIHGSGHVSGALGTPCFRMVLQPSRFYNLKHREHTVDRAYFQGRTVVAVAGIGHPERFFGTLASWGIAHTCHPFPDHHPFVPSDLPPGTVVMTEKDAVKCEGFDRDDLWVLSVDAQVEDGLQTMIMNTLKRKHGQQTA